MAGDLAQAWMDLSACTHRANPELGQRSELQPHFAHFLSNCEATLYVDHRRCFGTGRQSARASAKRTTHARAWSKRIQAVRKRGSARGHRRGARSRPAQPRRSALGDDVELNDRELSGVERQSDTCQGRTLPSKPCERHEPLQSASDSAIRKAGPERFRTH